MYMCMRVCLCVCVCGGGEGGGVTTNTSIPKGQFAWPSQHKQYPWEARLMQQGKHFPHLSDGDMDSA